jgi:hypothetical protein
MPEMSFMRATVLLFAFSWLGCSAIGATQYYVSPIGNDAHDGRSDAAAWRTAAKVNSTKFVPGDSILFRRGGNWHEQLIASSDGADGNPITYADYGDPAAARPTFWGSDAIPASEITSAGDSVYTFQTSVLPTGNAYWVFADHKFLTPAKSPSKMSADSFFICGTTAYVKTAGADPRSGAPEYTVSDRAQGTGADSSLICSDGHSNLVFNDLVGRETAAPADSGGVPDAYVFRIQGSSNVRLNNCEAYNGGKHHIGVINSTGFVGTNLHAGGCIPGLGYGNAGAFVSFSDASRHGDTSEWINCTVDHFDPQQQSFITHGPGMGSILIQNLTSLGCGIGIGTDGPGEKVTIKGGLLTGPTCDIYGAHIVVDGLRLSGNAKIDLFGNDNIVQNCIDQQSTNEQGSVVVRGQGNIIRFNTLDHRAAHGPCIDIKPTAIGTRIIGNLFTGGVLPLNDGGAPGLIVEYNGFDSAGGQPHGLEQDAHLTVGDPHFVDALKGNYALAPNSAVIGKILAAEIDGPMRDYLGNPRRAGSMYDIGAFQTQSSK